MVLKAIIAAAFVGSSVALVNVSAKTGTTNVQRNSPTICTTNPMTPMVVAVRMSGAWDSNFCPKRM